MMMEHRVKDFIAFIVEREDTRIRRANKEPKPWTKDPILQQYRFCNVYRELDTVTKWIAKNWRDPHADNPYCWFAMVVARLVNWPETLREIGFPCDTGEHWCKERFVDVISYRMKRAQKAFSSAYMIRSSKQDKAVYLANDVLDPIWKARSLLTPVAPVLLADWHATLMKFHGMGSFLAAQVVADAKYIKGSRFHKAEDWHTFVAPGPGSLRGMNRLEDKPVDYKMHPSAWHLLLRELRNRVNSELPGYNMRPLHAQDIQNCLCEFDKYERARLGEGRPRQNFNGL